MSNAQQHSPHNEHSDAAPALEDLARRYLDLWQDQWSALAADPAMADMVARSFAMMGPAAAGFAGFANMLASANLFTAAAPGASPPQNPFYGAYAYPGGPDHGRHPPAAAGSAAPAAASSNRTDDLAELRDRLSGMEQRLADLASLLGGAGGSYARGNREPSESA